MKMDPRGKTTLELELLNMHEAGPLRKATIDESGYATVQIAEKYFRYRLLSPAREVLRGYPALWMRSSELFERID